MLKVKLVPMTLLVPLIDNTGDHDCKMDENRYRTIHAAVDMLDIAEGNIEPVRQGVSQNPMPRASEVLLDAGGIINPNLSLSASPPVSQIDPPIDTTVRDSEMRPGREPEMTLEELRERPERTKSPPRPRANPWRHNE